MYSFYNLKTLCLPTTNFPLPSTSSSLPISLTCLMSSSPTPCGVTLISNFSGKSLDSLGENEKQRKVELSVRVDNVKLTSGNQDLRRRNKGDVHCCTLKPPAPSSLSIFDYRVHCKSKMRP